MLNPLRFNFCFSALFLALSLLSLDAMASRLTIEVTRGVDNPTRIAVVPFRRDHATGIDLASVVSADLSRSGRRLRIGCLVIARVVNGYRDPIRTASNRMWILLTRTRHRFSLKSRQLSNGADVLPIKFPTAVRTSDADR